MKKSLLLLSCLIGIQLLAILPSFGQKKQAKQQNQPVQIIDDPRLKDLDTAFQNVLKTWKAAGFAVAVVEKNKIIYAKGFGYRDIENKLPATPNTLFAIGSCSKAFTSSLIGVLQQDGKLDIDKPVHSFMPSVKFYNDAMNNSITLRDMMSHRTGLPRHDLSWYFFNTKSRDSILQRIQYQEPTAPVRQTWQYNNFMFAAQGAIAEDLTGKTWEENVKEKFFVPLGMKNSNCTIEELEKSPEPALGYSLYKDSIIKKMDYYHINGMAPAGSINSSVNDMAHWVMAWTNGGKFNDKQVIPANYHTQAISSQMVMTAALPSKERPELHFSTYGFGWMLSSYKGHYRVEHGGNIDGFSASTSFFPSDGIGIIVLTNQNGSRVPSIVRNLISDRLLKKAYFDWNGDAVKSRDKALAEKKKQDKDKVASTDKPHPAMHTLTDFAGSYHHPGYGSFRVYTKNDSLFAAAGGYTFWLRHATYDIFDVFMKDKSSGIDTANAASFKMQFQMNVAGQIESLTSVLEGGLKALVFTKGMDAKEIDAKDLKKYIGEYELSSMVVKVYTKGAKTLYALVPGQPEYELVPIGKDKFGLKILSGYYLQFELNPDGKVISALFMQPNGNFKAVKR